MEQNSSSEMPLLTFNSLYNILREEKKTKALCRLPEQFYEAISDFSKNKKAEIEKLKSENNLDKIKKEKHILIKSEEIILELINLRTMKISNIGIKDELFGDETLSKDNILEREKEFFETIKKATKKISKY